MKEKEVFKHLFKKCLKNVFEGTVESDVFEYGVFINQDASTLLLSYNTKSHYKHQLADKNSSFELPGPFLRWLIPEWSNHICDENKYVDEVNAFLYDQFQPKMYEEYDYGFIDEILDVILECLLEFKESNCVKLSRFEPIVYMELADSDINEKMKERISMLLNEKDYKAFLEDIEIEY